MNDTLCPHCGQSTKTDGRTMIWPNTAAPAAMRVAHIENKGEKDAGGKQVRRVKVVRVIDFYRRATC